MTIAVIIPAYNAAHFLAATIESVLRQTLPADDILVVDDGSTDGTAAVAASFPAPVRVISIQNSKLGAARNFGISQVDAEWIALIDADDLWMEDKLERQMQELARHPEASLCYTGYRRFTETGGVKAIQPTVYGCAAEDVKKRLLRGACFQPSSVILKRSALLAVGCFDPDPDIAEDWDLWLRMMHAGFEFAACAEPLLLYRIHDESITADGWRMIEKETRVFRTRALPHLKGLARLRAWSSFYGVLYWRAAYALRTRHDARCIPVMARSILHLPFADAHRYKVLAHMIYTRMTSSYFRQRSTR